MATIGSRFRIICKRGSGTFADVWKCKDLNTGEFVACKRMKQVFSNVEQAENLRELIGLRKLRRHENILNLKDVLFDKRSGKITLVFELMDMNLYELIQGRKSPFPDGRIQHYMYQLCKALDFMHRHSFFHRDVKPENILVKGDILKLGDFGSCRMTTSSPPFTEYISTRWYRPPECLLTNGWYTSKMDMWGAGCVFFEIISLQPLFPGNNEVDQVACIHRIIGTENIDKALKKFIAYQSSHGKFEFPHEDGIGIDCLLPHSSAASRDLIKRMCTYDADERITAKECLAHPYFRKCIFMRRDKKQMPLKMMEGTPSIFPGDIDQNGTIYNLSRETVDLELRPLKRSNTKKKAKPTSCERTSVHTMHSEGQLFPRISIKESPVSKMSSKQRNTKLRESPPRVKNFLPPIHKTPFK